ncbi:MAG: CopG family ribbon-helix-helix protein [Candidatus Nanohaloarchaea archaeon]
MEVISLSIDEETLQKIEEIQEKGSFNGRSELIRKAVEGLHQQVKDRGNLSGEMNAVIVVRHPHEHEGGISDISHEFDGIVTTQLHSKLSEEKCLEIFHIHGDAEEAIDFYNRLEGSKHTESVNILPQNQ